MNKVKQQRKPLKFEEGKSVKVVFDFDPKTAKSIEQDSKYSESGKATKYMLAVNKDEIIFATPALYEKLRKYNQGDSVTITFSEKRWQISSDSSGANEDAALQRLVESTETTILLRKIALDIDSIKSKLFQASEETNKDKAEGYPKDDDELDF